MENLATEREFDQNNTLATSRGVLEISLKKPSDKTDKERN